MQRIHIRICGNFDEGTRTERNAQNMILFCGTDREFMQNWPTIMKLWQ